MHRAHLSGRSLPHADIKLFTGYRHLTITGTRSGRLGTIRRIRRLIERYLCNGNSPSARSISAIHSSRVKALTFLSQATCLVSLAILA
jgi:hypothetical protein